MNLLAKSNVLSPIDAYADKLLFVSNYNLLLVSYCFINSYFVGFSRFSIIESAPFVKSIIC